MTKASTHPHANDNVPRPEDRPAWFDQLVLDYQPYIHGRVMRYRMSPQATEDVCQEVVSLALHRWPNFRVHEGEHSRGFMHWLTYLIRESASRYLKKKDKHKASSFNAEHPYPQDFNDDDGIRAISATEMHLAQQPNQEASLMLSDAIAMIQPKNVEIMVLLAKGYESQEVAAITGLHRSTVRMKAMFSRQRLAANENRRPVRKAG
jgi:RNA polymerase sigma factor (sigma-70 family)